MWEFDQSRDIEDLQKRSLRKHEKFHESDGSGTSQDATAGWQKIIIPLEEYSKLKTWLENREKLHCFLLFQDECVRKAATGYRLNRTSSFCEKHSGRQCGASFVLNTTESFASLSISFSPNFSRSSNDRHALKSIYRIKKLVIVHVDIFTPSLTVRHVTFIILSQVLPLKLVLREGHTALETQ